MTYLEKIHLPDFSLWSKMSENRSLVSLELEITARCNNDCRHCYINLSAGDEVAQRSELSFEEIESIADQAIALGAVWVLLSGGEPLLREDFAEIYLMLKRKGLLVSVFTNAILVNDKHIALFRKYPPRDLEVTVYGITESTYERVTRKKGSFRAFKRGLDKLIGGGVKLTLKAVAMQSTAHELHEIAEFCRRYTKGVFRFDSLLHLRYDRDVVRNRMINAERLSPEQIVNLEQGDQERFTFMQSVCDKLIHDEFINNNDDYLFHCGLGDGSCTISHDGIFRLCSSLWAPGTTYDLRKGSLRDAWVNFVPKVRDLRSHRPEYLNKCRSCPIINLCLWCPAHADLEMGELDMPVLYFCRVAEAREAVLRQATGNSEP